MPPPPPVSKPVATDRIVIRATNTRLPISPVPALAGAGPSGGSLPTLLEQGSGWSEESYVVQKAIENAWRGGPPAAAPPAPAPPSPRSNRKSTREPGARETMDERLQRLAAERVQAAARGKAVREQRARYLKGGGRPDASDFKAWMASDSASGAAAVSARVSLRS